METLFKGEQVTQISNHLGIPKSTVYKIFSEYVSYLRRKLESGETIKFLNVCYLKYGKQDDRERETLAYVSHVVGDSVGESQTVVYRVLTSFEDFMIKDLKRMNSYSIRGLVRIRLMKNYKGELKVRVKKSTAYNNWDIYVSTLPRFKRRAEVV